MKKFILAGKIYDMTTSTTAIESDAQCEFDSICGKGRVKIKIKEDGSNSWIFRIERTYPQEERYSVPSQSILNNETEIYSNDAFLFVGNRKDKEIINFGMMPYIGEDNYHYYFSESDFLHYWNSAASKKGFSKIKSVRFENTHDYFEIKLTI